MVNLFEPKSTSAAAAANPLNGIFALSILALVTAALLILAVVIAPSATAGESAVPVKSPAKRTLPFIKVLASTTPVAI